MRRKFSYGIIIFLSLAAIILAAYQITFKLLDKYNDTRLDPIQISSLKIDSKTYFDFIFLGDSHSQYWKMENQNILNIGLSGQTSEQIKIKTQLLKNELKGENLIISMGANDVKSVATNPERRQEIVNNCIENIEKTVDFLKPNFKEIYIITIPPDFRVGWKQRIFNYQETVQTKAEINLKIIQLAKRKNLLLINTEKAFKNKENLSDDGIHMNEKAYSILNEYLK